MSKKIVELHMAEDCEFKPDPRVDGSTNFPVEHHLWLNLSTCVALIERELDRQFHREFDATLRRFVVLALLINELDGLTLGEISRRLGVTAGSITPIVHYLAKAGFLELKTSSFDRRRQIAVLTDHGKRRFRRMTARYGVWLDRLFKRSLPAQLTEWTEQLERLRNVLQTAASELKR